jgi:hypothetical protein
VPSRFWVWLADRLVAQGRRARAARKTDLALKKSARKRARERAPLGRRLCSDPRRLERVAVVRRDTIAVLLEPEHPPVLVFPGQYLKPALVPSLSPIVVLVVNTAPVTLDVTVTRLHTADGILVDEVTLRVTVQLSANDRYRAVAELASAHGTRLEAHLLERVRLEVASEIHAAVTMSVIDELRGDRFQQVLAGRWQPRGFAGGALVRLGYQVEGVAGPEPERPPTAPEPKAVSPRPSTAAGSGQPPKGADFTLSIDAQLRRLWLSRCSTDLEGIAAARSGGSVTVVAVPQAELGAYDEAALKEVLTKHFGERSITFIAHTATTYQELVRAWFHRVDTGQARLVAVQSIDADDELRIVIDPASGDAGAPRIGTQADREALRALLPHARIELVPADRLAASGERHR